MNGEMRRILFTIADIDDYPVTAIDPCSDAIVLSRGEDSDEEIEEEIEEVVNHECLHILIKRVRDYSICSRLDDVSGWMMFQGKKYKIVFVNRNGEAIFFQLPE